MSNSKIRHWIYCAIGFLILCSIGWFLLLRESAYSDLTAADLFREHQQAYATTAAYLAEKEIYAKIEGIPTIDNRYGILPEDSDAYRNFNDALTELFRSAIAEAESTADVIYYRLPKSGGFLNQNYLVFAYGDAPPIYADAPRTALSADGWYYYLGKE
ncbi:MAG TPA: hypothetical protein DCG49_07165 [Ruminococcus sp.]|nr:hypothetical protein [Ruminococcus sp.]